MRCFVYFLSFLNYEVNVNPLKNLYRSKEKANKMPHDQLSY